MEFDEKLGRVRGIAAALTQSGSPRICMPTWRNFKGSYRRNEIFPAGIELASGMTVYKRRLKDVADFVARAGEETPMVAHGTWKSY